MFPELVRQRVLPFLLLAYPATFLLFQGGQYCGPLCFEPTPVAVIELIAVLLVLVAMSGVVTGVLRFDLQDDSRTSVRWLSSPGPLASTILLGVFALFVLFLAFDAMSLHEALWKPVVLPFSFLLFLPVWLLYVASFPLAALFPVVGIDSPPVVTLVFRGIVIAIGFPLSALFQSIVISSVIDGVQSNGD